MAAPFLLGTGAAGMLTAVACVVAGGPWFADGLRALRQRRLFALLRHRGAAELREGLVSVRGRVGLESPLFAPLSQRPCAGFELEVRGADGALAGRVREARAFRLEGDAAVVHVEAGEHAWVLGIAQERRVESPAELSAHVSALLERTAELRWLKARGGPLLLIERALVAGADGFAIGIAQHAHVAQDVMLERTGTDDVAIAHSEGADATWRLLAPVPLEHCVVSDREPEYMRLAPARWRVLGAVLGPALALAGLLELAQAAGRAMSGGV